jgi:hypothetical protein
VNGNGSGSCLMVSFGFTAVKPLGFAIIVLL